MPSAPLSADLAINLDTKAADIDRVTTFSATSGRWYDVIRSGTPPKHLWAGSLSTLGAGQGYFILANKATAVTINLKPVEILSTSPILNLTAGWNLIGFVTNKLETKHKLSQILNSLKATAVYGFDETKGYPLKMNIGADWAELGKGYWVYLEKAGKLEL